MTDNKEKCCKKRIERWQLVVIVGFCVYMFAFSWIRSLNNFGTTTFQSPLPSGYSVPDLVLDPDPDPVQAPDTAPAAVQDPVPVPVQTEQAPKDNVFKKRDPDPVPVPVQTEQAPKDNVFKKRDPDPVPVPVETEQAPKDNVSKKRDPDPVPVPVQPQRVPEEDIFAMNFSLSSADKFSFPIQHRYFLRQCYAYKSLTPRFTCTDTLSFRKYSAKAIVECAWDLWEVWRNKNQPNPWKRRGSSSSSPSASSGVVAISKRPSVHLVFLGDSHIRNLFQVFFRRLVVNRRVMYRSSEMKKDQWTYLNYNDIVWKRKKHVPMHELLHLDAPLRVTFYWDPFLVLSPKFLSSWMSGKESKPTYLITAGTAMHFMRATGSTYLSKGAEASSRRFFNRLKEVSPLLAKFSKTTPVIFKLQDHLKNDRSFKIYNQRLVDHYNRISYDLLAKSSNFTMWDSTIPLSDLYWDGCRLVGSVYKDTDAWNCNDKGHLGFVVIDQFLDMFLNGICCCSKNKGS
ncbi:uncharacterized protein LOC135220012 [Macrobrachium nipponense]|uniref:uncharacterized protein LOC135220012 n=1 Tax=Macrobrachium nipponense TaxID=159736 RepID=UPI0030C89718